MSFRLLIAFTLLAPLLGCPSEGDPGATESDATDPLGSDAATEEGDDGVDVRAWLDGVEPADATEATEPDVPEDTGEPGTDVAVSDSLAEDVGDPVDAAPEDAEPEDAKSPDVGTDPDPGPDTEPPPPECAPDAPCCSPDLCDPMAGPPTPGECAGKVDGAPCDDGDAADGLETCRAGVCVEEHEHCRCLPPGGDFPDYPAPSEAGVPEPPLAEPAWSGVEPADKGFAHAWGLRVIDLSVAWAITKGQPEITVAVLDTGCGPGLDGTVTVIDQVDLVDEDDVAEDPDGHGTGLAALVGGGLGVAPGVGLLCARIADESGVATYERLSAGLDWAVEAGASVVLVGVAGIGHGEGLDLLSASVAAAAIADVVVVAPAGSGGGGVLEGYPAALPTVLAVAAFGRDGLPTAGTDLSADTPLVAPGEWIVTKAPDGSPRYADGASPAAALVAGAAALVRTVAPTLDAAAVRRLLWATGAPIPAAPPTTRTRRLDVAASVTAAQAGVADLALVARAVDPSPLPGQACTIRVQVRNRGGAASLTGELSLQAVGGEITLADGTEGATLSQSLDSLLPGDAVEVLLTLSPAAGGVEEASATVSLGVTPGSTATTQVTCTRSSAVVHRLAIARATLEPAVGGPVLSAWIENRGNAPEPARTLNVVLWPAEDTLSVTVPPLAPGEQTSVTLALPGGMVTDDTRRQADLYLQAPPGQLDVAGLLGPLRYRWDPGADWAATSYIQLKYENLITDVPWRTRTGQIPVLFFYANVWWTPKPKKGGGGKAPFPYVLMMEARVRNPPGPASKIGAQIYSDTPAGPPVVLQEGVYATDADGAVIPSGDVLSTTTPAPGAHRLLWLSTAALTKASTAALPDPGASEGVFLETELGYYRVNGPGAGPLYRQVRRMHGVAIGGALPQLPDTAGSYFDAHFHSIAEWYRGKSLLGPKKNFGGPLQMLLASAAAIGLIEPAIPVACPGGVGSCLVYTELLDRIVTTDHNTFYGDADAPEDGPTSTDDWGLAPALSGSPEMDIYRQLFGRGAGEEVAVGGGFKSLGQHTLVYEADHVTGDWGLGGIPGLCTPSAVELLGALACNAEYPPAGGCDPAGASCLGNNESLAPIPGEFSLAGRAFAAHPFTKGFAWPDEQLREALSLPPT